MTHLPRITPSPAIVVACIALAVALGGTSYAAIKLPKNSVGAKQLKRNAVTSAKVKNNAIISSKVRNNAITSLKVKNNAITGADVIDAAQATGLRKADIGAVSTTATVDPPNIAAHSCASDSVSVPGAVTNDVVVAHPVNSVWSNLMYAVWLAQTDLVSLRICNPTGAAIDGPGLAFHFLLIR